MTSISPLPPGVEANDRVILFDGECVLCSNGAQILIRVDRKVRFKLGTIQSPEGKRLLSWHDLSADSPDTFILSEGSRLYVRSSAYIRILWQLGFPYQFLGAILWLIPKPIRDMAYNWLARNRFRLFGRRTSCMVLTPEQAAHLWKPSSISHEVQPTP
jgi:predicted DCC family thiol-disulfide oxidoreductase YuxK